MRDRLPTRDRLRGWGLQVPAVCFLCNVGDESRSHTFFKCNYVHQIWNAFFSHPRLNPPSTLDATAVWVRTTSTNVKLIVIYKLLLQATIYEIWKERNVRLHKSVSKSSNRVVRDIQAIMRQKLAGLDRPDTYSHPPVTSSPYTLLSLALVWLPTIRQPSRAVSSKL